MGWALCASLQAVAYNWREMMVARFFMGVFEACFAPGLFSTGSISSCGLYISKSRSGSWYREKDD